MLRRKASLNWCSTHLSCLILVPTLLRMFPSVGRPMLDAGLHLGSAHDCLQARSAFAWSTLFTKEQALLPLGHHISMTPLVRFPFTWLATHLGNLMTPVSHLILFYVEPQEPLGSLMFPPKTRANHDIGWPLFLINP